MDVWKIYKKLFGLPDANEGPLQKVNELDLNTEKPSPEILKPLFDQEKNLPPLFLDFDFAVDPRRLSIPTDKLDMPRRDGFIKDFDPFSNGRKNARHPGSAPGYEDAFDNPAHLQILLELLFINSELFGSNYDAKIPKTAEERQRWLEENFAPVEVIPSGKDFVVAMPEGYSLDFSHVSPSEVHRVMVEEMLGLSKTRMRCTAKRLEVKADSRDESIGNLYNLVCRNQHVNVYRHKAGQDESVLVQGREYFVIKQHDPLHDHASKDLIDFTINDIEPFGNRVSKGSLAGMHSHLLDPKLA